MSKEHSVTLEHIDLVLEEVEHRCESLGERSEFCREADRAPESCSFSGVCCRMCRYLIALFCFSL